MANKKLHRSTPRIDPAPVAVLPEIKLGQSLELLQELHILTRDGKLNQDSRRKLKQVYHLYHFIEPLMEEVMVAQGDLTLADHGAGKSYLGFILYDLFLKDRQSGHIFGIETRPELVEKSQELAIRLGFERMSFLNLSVEASMASTALPAQIDIVTALHACNTATDDAIRFALQKQAKFIVLVPCCQAEVAAVLRKNKNESFSRTPLSELWRHPLHTREFGSHLTNVFRCLLLESHGYQVTVTELVGWEHSMKNELIIARKFEHTHGGARKNAQERLAQILQELNLEELKPRFAYCVETQRSQSAFTVALPEQQLSPVSTEASPYEHAVAAGFIGCLPTLPATAQKSVGWISAAHPPILGESAVMTPPAPNQPPDHGRDNGN